MAVATVLGWGLGYWLDSKWETGPWLMLLGLLIGVAAGFKGLIRTANQVNCRQVQQANRLQEQRGSQNNLKEKLRREVI